jgi:phosphoribosylaminoimidazolecarboxamide formyltransferase / IMP cyclohydrolase
VGNRRRALLSVTDKTGLIPFGRALQSLGYDLVSTGGTAKALAEGGLKVTKVEDLTGFPEILQGRVKTLHPLVHGGILAVPDDPEHAKDLKTHGIEPFDLVAVNLYPFEKNVGRKDITSQELVELIDIGGPTLIRAAAKNHKAVTVLVDPTDYDRVLHHLRSADGLTVEHRARLAAKAFAHTAHYDASIAHWMGLQQETHLPEVFSIPMRRRAKLRYGENHHQKGAFYSDDLKIFGTEASISTAEQIHGKELSYNNILDGDTAVETVKEFDEPTVVIIKHATPSGIASAKDLVAAWKDAYATDTYSPFGGVVAVNRLVTGALADELLNVFLEVIIAPAFDEAALEKLTKKKNLRLLTIRGLEQAHAQGGYMVRSVTGGVLLQDRDTRPISSEEWRTVTKAKPTKAQLESLVFAAKCVKHVRSNAVVFAKGTRTVGIGGGQTARVDAVYIATKKGGDNIRGSVMASDAFFPFKDTIEAAAEAGVKTIVQPGGSIRDEEVIAAADKAGIAMVFSGHRSFRH